MNELRRLAYFILILFIGVPLNAQNERPKVGLVLSGGGAKGIAHIGVLKALEEAGLTPDYITGTSMGSIMGGLYSIGYSADELREMIEGVDWDHTLTNKMSLDEITFEEKFYYGRYLLDFFVKDGELKLPEGVIEGQALMELFSRYTRPVHGIKDFNDFPIPFACVGADIATGEPVVLNHGSLARSMRASMAIPTVFTPVRIDGKLLVDGGLVRNMPVPEIIDMGADIIIGVFVGTDLKPEEELHSALDILTQSAFITAVYDAREQLAKCDILIQPNIEGFGASSFNSYKEILEKGDSAGMAYIDVFRHLADSLNQLGPPHTVIKPERPDEYVFNSINIEGNTILSDDFIAGKLDFEKGKPMSLNFLESRIKLIYGTQYFDKIWYEIVAGDSEYELNIHVIERPRTHFRFSYHYDTENKGGIVANITLRNLLLNKSRLIFEADLATKPSLLADYFKYLGKKQNIALGATGIYALKEFPLYDSTGAKSDIFNNTYVAGGFKVQTTRNQNSTIGIQVLWASSNLKQKIASEASSFLNEIDYRNTTFSAFHRFNSLNDHYFPTKGMLSNLEFSTTTRVNGKIILYDSIEIDAADSYGLIETDLINSLSYEVMPVFRIFDELSIIAKARMKMSSIQNSAQNINEFDFIGGITPGLVNSNEYYGAGTKEFLLANYFYGRISLQYNVLRNLYLLAHFNYLDAEYPMKWIFPGIDTGKAGGRERRFGYGLSAGYKSPIGPIFFHVSKDHYLESWRAALSIGFYY